MEFETLVETRRSVRGYQDKPVARDVIEEIIQVTKGAPSSMNTQPWNLYVVTGEPLNRIRKGNTENMVAGVKPQRDFPTKEAYEGIHRQRQIEIAVQLFEAMGRNGSGGRRKLIVQEVAAADCRCSALGPPRPSR